MFRRLLALACSAVALALAARSPSAAATVSIAIVSGTPQSAHAFIAQHGPRYETTFDAPLVVRVSRDEKVRFRCETANCLFPPQEQGDAVIRVDPRTYDVKAAKGVASIKLLVSTITVEPVVVSAQSAAEPHGPRVTFALDVR